MCIEYALTKNFKLVHLIITPIFFNSSRLVKPGHGDFQQNTARTSLPPNVYLPISNLSTSLIKFSFRANNRHLLKFYLYNIRRHILFATQFIKFVFFYTTTSLSLTYSEVGDSIYSADIPFLV